MKSRKKKKWYPFYKQRQAYWVGVGISVARDQSLRNTLMEKSPYSKSVVAGYNADNYRDVGTKFKK